MSELDEFGYSKDFKKSQLGDVAHVEMGQSPDSRFVAEDPYFGYPFLQGNAEFGVVSPSPKFGCIRPAKLAKKRDVLISVRAPVGAVNIADRDYCIGRGLAGIRLDGIEPNLAAQLIQHQSAELRRVAQGTTFEAISKTDLQTLQLRLPPVAELPAIAKVLSTLDIAIHQTEAIFEKLKQVKQGLLHDLLTRGVDTDGELRPSYEAVPELYQDSPVGWIPKGWDCGNLEAWLVGKPKNGYSPQEAPEQTGIQMLGLGCLTKDGFMPAQLKAAPRNDKRLTGAMLSTGDLLISRANTRALVGLVGVYKDVGVPCIYPDLMMRLVPSSDTCAEFLQFVLQSPRSRRQIQAHAVGTSESMVKISGQIVSALLVALPKKAEQVRILERLASCDERLATESDKATVLREVKVGLMDDILTGRVRVTPLLAQYQ